MSLVKTALRGTLRALLTREQRRKLGAFVLNEANGDNDGDAAQNGEFELLRQVLRLTEKNGPRTLFDVGANVGDWSRECLRSAGAGDKLFAFEPSAKTFERLRQTIGSDARASAINAGLSDHSGPAELNLAATFSGSNSVHRPGPIVNGCVSSEAIQLVAGGAFCAERGIERIDFLKIDTEGHELAVMRGFDSMLIGHKISVLQFEYGGTWLDARILLADAFTLLQSKGYTLAKILPAGLQILKRYDQRMDTFQYANFAALIPEMNDRLRGFLISG